MSAREKLVECWCTQFSDKSSPHPYDPEGCEDTEPTPQPDYDDWRLHD